MLEAIEAGALSTTYKTLERLLLTKTIQSAQQRYLYRCAVGQLQGCTREEALALLATYDQLRTLMYLATRSKQPPVPASHDAQVLPD